MRHVSTFAPLGVALSLGLGGVAFGHAYLTDPLPRVSPARLPPDPGSVPSGNAASGKTTGPCGAGAAFTTAATPTVTLTQGVPFEFKYLETIDHPGHYRIALNPAAVNGTGAAEYILGDELPDLGGAIPAGGRPYTSTLDIPLAVPDGNYVLQFIQVMTENPLNPTYYYGCADVIVGAPGPLPDGGGLLPDGGVGGTPDAGGAAAADGGGGGGGGAGNPPGLCSYAGRAGSRPGLGLGLAFFMAGALIWRRRR